MPRARCTLLAALALLAGLPALAAPAAAHADLLGAEPEPNTEIDDAPDELVLAFSEPLEDTYTRVQVVDANGTGHVGSLAIGDDRRRVVADLDPLEEGIYTVEWRALSSADGHTTSHSYLLGLNTSLTATGPEAGPTPQGPLDPAGDEAQTQVEEGGPGEAVARATGFLAASLAAGLPLFLLLARGIETPGRVERRWWALAIGGAGGASLAALGVAASLATRIDLPFAAALGTTPGQNLLTRAGLFAAAAILLAVGGHRRSEDDGAAFAALGTLAAAGGLLVTSLGSHAAAQGVGTGLAITVDWLHQVAVAFWVAGVAALAVVGISDTSVGSSARLIRRFSPLAVASVALIVLTGTLASLERLSSPTDLWRGLYGVALSAKILLLAPLVALGAYHRYRLLPRLEEPGQAGAEVGRLRRSAFVELGLMIVVLLAAGAMTTTSPPESPAEQAPYASFADAQAADTPGPFAPELADSQLATLNRTEAENVTVHLIEPARLDRLATGNQPLWILVADERGDRGTPVTDADVEVQAWMPEHGHGTRPETDPAHVHEGMYDGATHWLMEGAWELRFNVTLPTGDVLRYEVTTYVGEQADPLDQREAVHSVEEDGYAIEVFLDPQPVTVGVQNLTVRVTPTEEPVLPENADVVANLEAPSGDSEGQTLALDRWREDAWTREDAIFTETGNWTTLVALQGKGTYVQTDVPINATAR
jgi:copper transport protein